MKINKIKLQNVLALAAPKRYSHFIKVVADQRKVWGLYANGWALAETDDNRRAIVLWPAKEYAELCAYDCWADYKACEIDFDTFLEVLIPKLSESGTLAGVFPTPKERGITPDLSQLERDLRNELAKIE